MSKSTLSITVPAGFTEGATYTFARTVEVPCRLPEAFNFKFAGKTYTAIARAMELDAVVRNLVDGGLSPQAHFVEFPCTANDERTPNSQLSERRCQFVCRGDAADAHKLILRRRRIWPGVSCNCLKKASLKRRML